MPPITFPYLRKSPSIRIETQIGVIIRKLRKGNSRDPGNTASTGKKSQRIAGSYRGTEGRPQAAPAERGRPQITTAERERPQEPTDDSALRENLRGGTVREVPIDRRQAALSRRSYNHQRNVT